MLYTILNRPRDSIFTILDIFSLTIEYMKV
nr:MAG TPA: hypothetical protein [Caudoviricetes sp.]